MQPLLPLQPGDRVPDLTLTTLDGRPVPLSQAWHGGAPALLVFLRHLG